MAAALDRVILRRRGHEEVQAVRPDDGRDAERSEPHHKRGSDIKGEKGWRR